MIRSWLEELRKDTQGSPALEFALIAPLFFAAVFGTFEIGRALYERNRISSAAAIAMRTVALDNDATDVTIENAIKAKLNNLDVTKLTINLCNETVATQVFKKVNISYDHKLLVNAGTHFSGFTLQATRFAPAANGAGSGSACASP